MLCQLQHFHCELRSDAIAASHVSIRSASRSHPMALDEARSQQEAVATVMDGDSFEHGGRAS
jgi:hypothetical protein